MSDPIRDELHRLSEEFRKLAGLPESTKIPSLATIEKNNISVLMDEFGLTYDQAKVWLEQEPNYIPIRRKVTPWKSDEEVTEPDLLPCT